MQAGCRSRRETLGAAPASSPCTLRDVREGGGLEVIGERGRGAARALDGAVLPVRLMVAFPVVRRSLPVDTASQASESLQRVREAGIPQQQQLQQS